MNQKNEPFQTRSGLAYSSTKKIPAEILEDDQVAKKANEKAVSMLKDELMILLERFGLDPVQLKKMRKEQLVDEYVAYKLKQNNKRKEQRDMKLREELPSPKRGSGKELRNEAGKVSVGRKKRKRDQLDESVQQDQALEKMGKTLSTKVRKTESEDTRVKQNFGREVTITKNYVPAFLRVPTSSQSQVRPPQQQQQQRQLTQQQRQGQDTQGFINRQKQTLQVGPQSKERAGTLQPVRPPVQPSQVQQSNAQQRKKWDQQDEPNQQQQQQDQDKDQELLWPQPAVRNSFIGQRPQQRLSSIQAQEVVKNWGENPPQAETQQFKQPSPSRKEPIIDDSVISDEQQKSNALQLQFEKERQQATELKRRVVQQEAENAAERLRELQERRQQANEYNQSRKTLNAPTPTKEVEVQESIIQQRQPIQMTLQKEASSSSSSQKSAQQIQLEGLQNPQAQQFTNQEAQQQQQVESDDKYQEACEGIIEEEVIQIQQTYQPPQPQLFDQEEEQQQQQQQQQQPLSSTHIPYFNQQDRSAFAYNQNHNPDGNWLANTSRAASLYDRSLDSTKQGAGQGTSHYEIGQKRAGFTQAASRLNDTPISQYSRVPPDISDRSDRNRERIYDGPCSIIKNSFYLKAQPDDLLFRQPERSRENFDSFGIPSQQSAQSSKQKLPIGFRQSKEGTPASTQQAFYKPDAQPAQIRRKVTKDNSRLEDLQQQEASRQQEFYEDDVMSLTYRALFVIGFVILIITLGVSIAFFKPTDQIFCPTQETYNVARYKQIESCYDYSDQKDEIQKCLKFKHCKPCPSNGFCDSSGELKCDSEYIREKDQCVLNKNLEIDAYHTLYQLERNLQELRGQWHCGNQNEYKVSYEQMSLIIADYFDSNLEDRGYTLDSLMIKIVQLLNQKEQLEIKDLDIQAVDISRQRSSKEYALINDSNKRNLKFFSEKESHTFGCMIKIFLSEYLFLIIICTVLSVYLGFKYLMWMRTRKQYSTARSLYQEVKSDLGQMIGITNGLSQTDILRRYLGKGKSNDGLKRDESAFYKQVWPLMEDLRKSDKKVQTFEREQFGKLIPIWQLK